MDGSIRRTSVDVDGRRISYLEAGTGEPVLLVHGITTYSTIWESLMPALAARRRIVALDLLGCGDSDKPLDESYALRDHAERISRFMEALGLVPAHYVGHDLGGGIGQILAARHPERLLDLTLVNSVGYDFWPVQPIIAMRTPIVRELAMASLDLGTFRLIVKRALYHKEKLTDDLMGRLSAPLRTPEGRKAFLHFAHCLDNRDLMDIEEPLRALRLPVLVVRGQADPYLSAEISERLRREIPGSELLTFATAGHYLMIDEPETLAAALVDFFEKRRG